MASNMFAGEKGGCRIKAVVLEKLPRLHILDYSKSAYVSLGINTAGIFHVEALASESLRIISYNFTSDTSTK